MMEIVIKLLVYLIGIMTGLYAATQLDDDIKNKFKE